MTEATGTAGTDLGTTATQAAAAKLESLSASPEWRQKVLAGSGPEVQQLHDLIAASNGEGDQISRIVSGTEPVPDIQFNQGSVPLGATMRDVADLQTRVGLSADVLTQLLSGAPASKSEFDQVKQLRADALSDADFVARLLKGDRTAVRDLTLANVVLIGGYREVAT
jgi:hypothetical protein